MTPIADAAAFLAPTWPVFPCDALKHPLTPRGFKDAVREPDIARSLFRRPEAVLIGVPTGEESGLAVWDFDTKHDGAGLKWLAENEHRIPRTRRHGTPSGGVHLLFRYPRGVPFNNSAGYIHKITGKLMGVALGVDTRGNGGYICAPPSPNYTILDDAMPAEMPQWMIDAYLNRKSTPPAPEPAPYTAPRAGIPDRYAEAALKGECEAVSGTPEGGRNHQLNVSAVKLGSLVAAGALDRRTVEYELKRAALHAGLDQIEAEKTIASGLGYGLTQPRQIPERPTRMEPRKAPPVEYDPETGEILDNPTELRDGEPRPFDLLWFADIRPSLDAKDFVQGVLVEGSAAVVYGESNAGKTFWATDLALHVAAGKEWNGRRVEQGGVIYCVLEGGVGFRNRVTAWRSAHRPDGAVHFAAIQSGMNLLQPEADTPRLIATIKQAAERIGQPVKLIVIDTLSRAFSGGNENASEDMGLLVKNMDLIRAETGACVLFIHHSGKDQAKGARGHSLLRAAIDTEVEVKADETSGIKTATTVKQREIKKGEVFSFTLEVVELGKNQHRESVTTCVVRPSQEAPVTQAKLSAGARFGLVTLSDAIVTTGRPAMSRDYPEGVRIVALEAWRKEFYARSHLDTTDAKRQAFHRAVKDLRDAKAVGVLNDYAWLTKGDGDAK